MEDDRDTDAIGEFGDPGDTVVAGEAFVAIDCDSELVFPVGVTCEPEEIDAEAEGEVVVEAPGPAFAA